MGCNAVKSRRAVNACTCTQGQQTQAGFTHANGFTQERMDQKSLHSITCLLLLVAGPPAGNARMEGE
jgi:hypothetical protein